MACFQGIFGIEDKPSIALVQHSDHAGVDAACKLIANFTRVVQDITNPGPKNIDGKTFTQDQLRRVDPNHTPYVQAMVRAVCCRLLGKETSGPSTKEEAMVWTHAAIFLALRVHGSPDECDSRTPDMSSVQAAAMKTVLGQIEAASKLMHNKETVIKDMTNAGPNGVYGGQLTQVHLKRMDPKHKDSLDQMVQDVTARLFGQSSQLPDKDKMLVWAEAARFLAARVQGTSCEDSECDGRKADMSTTAAKELKKMLGQLEAAYRLMSNHEKVVQDIANPGPNNIYGKTLTQLDLKRVDGNQKAAVDAMVKAVGSRLLGQEVPGPSKPEEALAWVQAAVYLSGRIQAYADDMPGRAPDMSPNAAREMRKVLGQIEAASKLFSNRETVVKDITNPGPNGVCGGRLTQKGLKRVDEKNKESVDAMMHEVCARLLGKKMSEPTRGQEKVWAQAATFFDQRIQSSAGQSRGRKPDMSLDAAAEMRSVLAQITSREAAWHLSKEAALALLSNQENVVKDIVNPGPANIYGKTLTQTNLQRVDKKYKDSVDTMIIELCCRLLGKTSSKPSTPEEAQVWAQAATYLSGRIQGTPEEMPGRKPDMSSDAATALRLLLGQMTASK